jgi:branched-subunit amino acid transport protein
MATGWLRNAPSSPPVAATVPQSLWQHNNIALRATRYYGFAALRTSAIAAITY